MAEPLKNSYGPEIPRKLAVLISHIHSDFPSGSFLDDVLEGYGQLELMSRGRQIAQGLAKHLPSDYRTAVRILVESMGPKLEQTDTFGMAPFLYMPYAFFIATHGLDYWEESMRAQYELTQRFTAEFSIRPFLIHHQDRTLARLSEWTHDPSPHVRRLVSEGTRPRLPWAMRLPAFQKNPRPVLALLEQLKNDPELYVRRSVANNLNDIGKDNPALLFKTSADWMKKASPEREWLVRHALRSRIKAGEPRALSILGYRRKVHFKITKKSVGLIPEAGKRAALISFAIQNTAPQTGSFLLDFRVHYVKANGQTAPKVFKLTEVRLRPSESVSFQKKVSLEEMTTRKHYPGRHKVDALVNGRMVPLGSFVLS